MKPLILLPLLLLAGCAGGPVKDFYNPAVIGAKYPGPVTVELVDSPRGEAERLVGQSGYKIIGTSSWTGEYVQAKELQAQARRVGANHVVYGARYVPPQPGAWSFRFGQGFGTGGTGGGMTDQYVVFLGR